MIKRSFDIVASLFGLLVCGMPFAIIALAVRLTSSGPALYRQQRVGRYGRVFWLYNVRTMRCMEGGPQVTAEGDTRITPIGRVLRRLRIDELPQLWNILRGDMSVVGPRPEVERFVQQYTPEQRRVLEQTPGLTGLSQLAFAHEAELLQGYPDPEDVYVRYVVPSKLAIDLEYGRTRTFLSDLSIVVRTMLVVLGKKYGSVDACRIPPPGEVKLARLPHGTVS